MQKPILQVIFLHIQSTHLSFKRTSLTFAQISGDDAYAGDYHRNNRRLNFVTSLIEGAGIIEWIWIKARTGNRYNVRSPAGRYLGVEVVLE